MGVCLDIFSLIDLFSFLSPFLWETARYRLKYCLKRPLNPKQPTNQPSLLSSVSASLSLKQVEMVEMSGIRGSWWPWIAHLRRLAKISRESDGWLVVLGLTAL